MLTTRRAGETSDASIPVPRRAAGHAAAGRARRMWAAPLARWAAAWALACGAALGIVAWTLHPSRADLADLARYLVLGGAASVLLGAAALWLTAVGRAGGVRVKFAVPAVLTALIISFNVLLVARLMFLAPIDTALVLDILIFSVLIAVTLSSSIAAAIAAAIRRVEAAARRMAEGEYSVRLPEHELGGAAELARLGRWFNQMAASVEGAFERQRRAEQERRQIVAALSHDLRTPLASIRAMIEAITDGVVADPAAVARYQRSIRGEVRHLSVLIDDLFELSRLEAAPAAAAALRREPVALEDVLSDVLEAMRDQAARRGIELGGGVAGPLPAVAVDVRQLHRVLTNLTQNALRHTPRGGRVMLHAQAGAAPGPGKFLLVRVVDTGEGIAAGDLPHVFEPTFRGESSRPRVAAPAAGAEGEGPVPSGAGLGLTIARGLVEAHGGRIWIESPAPAEAALLPRPASGAAGADGPGTCVAFTLPLDEGRRVSREAP